MNHVDLERFHAQFEDVKLSFGLIIDTITFSGGSTHAQMRPFSFTPVDAGKVEVTISAESIAGFLEQKSPGGLRKFKVRVGDGKLYVEAVAKIIVDVKASIVCQLQIEGEKRVNVVLESVDVMGGPAKKLVESQIAKVNPIFDAEDFPVTVLLKSVSCENGHIVVSGEFRP